MDAEEVSGRRKMEVKEGGGVGREGRAGGSYLLLMAVRVSEGWRAIQL